MKSMSVNSGSKIQAIEAMMVCMTFNYDDSIHPFYVEVVNILDSVQSNSYPQILRILLMLRIFS